MGSEIAQLLSELREDEVIAKVKSELEAGTDPNTILEMCQEGMVLVGDRFEEGEYFISELMMSGEIFNQISEILAPGLTGTGGTKSGKIVFGTVQGDIHDIGKNLVVGLLRASNFDVIDLGVDVPPEKFVEALKETGAPVLALSGLLTIAFDAMKATVKAVEDAGLRDGVKIVLGGAPVDDTVVAYAGADAAGGDAQHGVKLCKKWFNV
ncbi:MAG: cobalamin-binding protein [Deltaproteobacteria bacterium]|nr:MAG: cobalamin-binding protein [Deltaproteobacteria bacterium]